ncbi:scavenger receptor class F member 1-like [Haliotis rufescens]|uniref:scavenger receptor class F member 1-like n=1 Tax=Haliotis rufescens TaxID=6454 RepID=UPI00201E7BD0|nr:scavenger receptor class F member 1-like [Haliotis rufescens]
MGKMCNIQCMHNCSKCEREYRDDCIKCDQGYFGKLCDKCPNACGEQGCYDNGVCKKDCSAINVCGDKCLPGCKICNDTLGKCQECANNFMGENCETPCSDNCRSICSTQNCLSQCDRDTGRCLHGCKPGSWGERCADLCSPRCLDQNCNQISGQCVQCIRGYHGSKCHLPCVNCKESGCLKTTGICKNCDAGYYGLTCTQTCLNCSSDVCDRISGLCSNVSMTNIIDDSSTISSAVPRYLPAISSITLVIAVFGAVAFIVIIILVYRQKHLVSNVRSCDDLCHLM